MAGRYRKILAFLLTVVLLLSSCRMSSGDSDGKDASLCTMSVSCFTLLENQDLLKKEKRTLVPDDGWIVAPTETEFYAGESAFDLLLRELKAARIHLEFVDVPLYGSAYIEGINNLYEFDAGELSGWMYKVNGVFPNYGCSQYLLQPGDVVEWVFTCDLGEDVGGGFTEGQVPSERGADGENSFAGEWDDGA